MAETAYKDGKRIYAKMWEENGELLGED